MVAVRKLNELDFGILFIVLLQVGEELFAITGVDGSRNVFGALGEEGKHSVVNEIVDENDSAFGAANQVGNVIPCVPYAAGGEDLLGKHLGRVLIHFVENGIDFFIGLDLVPFQVGDTHQNACVLYEEFSHSDECIDDSDAGVNGSLVG